MKMNPGKAFYLVNSKSIYTDVDIVNFRRERLGSMVEKNSTNQRSETTIRPPTDLATKLNDLVQRNMTEKGYSNCWPLSGPFFDELSFHG